MEQLWISVKKWIYKIKKQKNISPFLCPIDNDKKIIFNIKILYIIKYIFNINDICSKNINLKDYSIKNIVEKCKEIDILNIMLLNDNELQKIIEYFYIFKPIKLIFYKIQQILKPIFLDEYYNKLFTCDDDILRFTAPICLMLLYLYIVEQDITKTIQQFNGIYNEGFQFFIISYLIIDNIMDSDFIENDTKIYFMKWLYKIINNPQLIILNDNDTSIWQCITFTKYYNLFYNKYPYETNKNIYVYIKKLIETLKVSDNIQRENRIDNNKIIEYTFKKSYMSCYFLIKLINIQYSYILNDNEHILLAKFTLFIQLMDDFLDINKDIIEKNNTFFKLNSKNKIDNHIILNFINLSFDIINEINIKDIELKTMIDYILKYYFVLILFLHKDKLKQKTINKLKKYCIINYNIINIFENNKYDIYKKRYFIDLLKSKMINDNNFH